MMKLCCSLMLVALLAGCAWPGIDNHKRPNLEQTGPVGSLPWDKQP